MDLARLKALIDLAASSPLGELDLVENGYRVRIRRAATDVQQNAASTAHQAGGAPTAAAVAPIARRSRTPTSGMHHVTSPMYGIFHRASSPDSAPFVSVGCVVKRGDRLCLLEAMKVFNVIEADADGTIAEILVENGQEVEPGQGLFRITP